MLHVSRCAPRLRRVLWTILLMTAAAGPAHAQATKVPEIDGTTARSGITVLLLGAALVVRERRPRNRRKSTSR